MVPVGQFLIRGKVTIKDGVTLAGLNESSLAPGPLKGSVILATGGRDHEEADPLFEMESSAAVRSRTSRWRGKGRSEAASWGRLAVARNSSTQTSAFPWCPCRP